MAEVKHWIITKLELSKNKLIGELLEKEFRKRNSAYDQEKSIDF